MWHNVVQVHPCCYIVFPCFVYVYTPCFVHGFIRWWTFRLFPHFGYYKWSCCEHSCTHFCIDMFSFLLGRSSTFFVAVCIFLGLIIASFIHSFTSHVPITNSALNLMTEETLNMVVNSFSLPCCCLSWSPPSSPPSDDGCPGLLSGTYPDYLWPSPWGDAEAPVS